MRRPSSSLRCFVCYQGVRFPSFFYVFCSSIFYKSLFIVLIIIKQDRDQMLKILKQLSAYIYDLFISTFFTIAAHLSFINQMTLTQGNFLDVGCGTGAPLKTIVNQIKKKHKKIVGVDLHPEYTQKAIKLFEKDEDVQIYNMDFYKLQENIKLKFRFIFFSFSFMLMPDHLKALQVAKRALQKNENSRIAFALTLNKDKNSLLAQIKPLIKKFTTVDFGNVVYQDDLLSIINEAGLEVTKKVRVYRGYNIFLRLSPVYYIECKVKNRT